MLAERDVDRLLCEHGTLLRAHAQLQARCTALLHEQAERIRRLDAELMRTRAAAIRSLSALAWEREDRAALEQAAPGLKRRAAMGRQVEALQARVHELTRRLHAGELAGHAARADDALPRALDASLEASLEAADLVICQTGCLSHGDYWRVQDHCKRSGKVCMLVDQPDRVHIVRIESLA
ncbi:MULTISPECIES: DUF2325 domain-containing protein [Massilia]|jgi:Uncharacterized protein conserved in bacteria (DUF2325)|uniref:DUF2325 domain-containing protein n=1 Tax=Massilia TaxID=149698 RepID=UPI0016079FB7|nr:MULTISPECIES: DUF2325 domain-containing protein [Massilia]QYG03732.1 DUF2325 domain-containing protein [Massilia sp. NP310]